jgi:transcriptional regulator with XRE-family HTH domain
VPAQRFSAKALRSLRRSAGVSRDSLAFAISRTTGSIANYEQGRTAPSAETVARIAEVLDCEIGDLFEEASDAVA